MVAAGCRRGSHPSAADARVNVVLVLADTLQASHLGCYGYRRATSPVLDGLAQQGTLFEHARSQAACTFPSVNSLLTSTYPARFLGQEDQSVGIPAGMPTVATLLTAAGYRTAAVSASPVVRASPARYNPVGGFEAGFGVFDEACLWQPGSCVTRTALAEVDHGAEPFFLYLHYMDPHGPYDPPREYARRWSTVYSGDHDFIAAGNPQPLANMVYNEGPQLDVTAADIAHLMDLYDDEIAYVDRQLGELVAGLAARGVLDRTLLVVLADHGEEFMTHGDHVEHCRVVYDSSTRTPLVLRGPGVPAGRRVAGAVENLDVVPTILELLGQPTPAGLQGTSLVPQLAGAAPAGLAFSLQYPWAAADDGRFKLMIDLAHGSRQLFDLAVDPGETTDVAVLEADAMARLEGPLHDWVAREVDAVRDRPALAGSLDQLRALGYLQ